VAVSDLFKYIGTNRNSLQLVTREWKVVGHEIKTYPNVAATYSAAICEWVETPTKIVDSNGPLFTILKQETPRKQTEQMRGWQLTCFDTSNSGWYGGVESSVKFNARLFYSNETLDNLEKFIKKIPKKSRKKLIKLLYLYNLKEEKSFITYERLFHRLRIGFDFHFSSWSCSELYKWDLLKQTFPIDVHRNMKINRLLRFFRK
jgi:hypothetical protein